MGVHSYFILLCHLCVLQHACVLCGGSYVERCYPRDDMAAVTSEGIASSCPPSGATNFYTLLRRLYVLQHASVVRGRSSYRYNARSVVDNRAGTRTILHARDMLNPLMNPLCHLAFWDGQLSD